MTPSESTMFNEIEKRQRRAKSRVSAAITGQKDEGAAALIRWMFTTDTPASVVFSSKEVADQFDTFEGINVVMDRIDACLDAGRGISLVKTVSGRPVITFLNAKKSGFAGELRSELRSYGHAEGVLEALKPVGAVDTVSAFIEEYRKFSARRLRMIQDVQIFG